MPAGLLRCSCPRCFGKTYDDVAEYVVDHQGAEVRSHEVHLIESRPPAIVNYQTWVGDLEDCQVLVTVFPLDNVAQVAFRPERHDVWGPPIELEPGQ